jgi:hypothetical protein
MTKSTSLKIANAALIVLVVGSCNHSASTRKTSSDASADSQGKTDGNFGDKADGATVADVPVAPDASSAKSDAVAPVEALEVVPGQPDVATGTADTAKQSPDMASLPSDSAGLDEKPNQLDTAADFGQEPDATPDIPILPPPVDAADVSPNKTDASKKDVPPVIVDATVDTTVDAKALDGPADGSTPNPFQLAVAPNRMLDLVFMIDNSPSMAAKQAKLKAQFPELINALKDPTDGTLPDLRIAIIDSDLGTAGAYSSGSCGPKTLPDGTSSIYGDEGKFQMIGAQACGVIDPSALWLETSKGQAVNYTGDIGTVFSCLAANLGTLGCGFEHQLQAFEFALVADGVGNTTQHQMLRPSAYLGLVFLSDEDDCSAAPDDGIFGTSPGGLDFAHEAASLRCATRAHTCGGVNLTETPPGFPTTASFSVPFQTCAARTDDCPNPLDGLATTDTSVPTTCSPLRSVGHMAAGIKALKSKPDEQILVAGIFGWPLSDADMATATYKIAPTPNPNTADTAHPTIYDYWPVCYDPNHLPNNPDLTTGFDVTAANWGATGGLRMSAFVDQFGDNGVKFSICQPDFSAAMTKIGSALSKKMQNLCLPAVYAELTCTANYLIPDADGTLVRQPTPVPKCNIQHSNAPCYSLASSPTCPGAEYLVQLNQGVDAGNASLPYGTVLEFRCQ